jgi:hypothetical protein
VEVDEMIVRAGPALVEAKGFRDFQQPVHLRDERGEEEFSAGLEDLAAWISTQPPEFKEHVDAPVDDVEEVDAVLAALPLEKPDGNERPPDSGRLSQDDSKSDVVDVEGSGDAAEGAGEHLPSDEPVRDVGVLKVASTQQAGAESAQLGGKGPCGTVVPLQPAAKDAVGAGPEAPELRETGGIALSVGIDLEYPFDAWGRCGGVVTEAAGASVAGVGLVDYDHAAGVRGRDLFEHLQGGIGRTVIEEDELVIDVLPVEFLHPGADHRLDCFGFVVDGNNDGQRGLQKCRNQIRP